MGETLQALMKSPDYESERYGQTEQYTFKEFVSVCRARQINRAGYSDFMMLDARLPARPSQEYSEQWALFGGWKAIAEETEKKYYPFPEFLEVCKRMKFIHPTDYKKRCHYDERLPKHPDYFYEEAWLNAAEWECVTGMPMKNPYTFAEFLAACKNRNFTSVKDYEDRSWTDLGLPENPEEYYQDVWGENGGWSCILIKKEKKNPMQAYDLRKSLAADFPEFVQICQSLGVTSRADYFRRYKLNPRLRSDVERRFRYWFQKVGGWGFVTGKKFYSFLEFLQVCHQMSLTGKADYLRRLKLNPTLEDKLTKHPDVLYGERWVSAGGWKCIVKENQINTSGISQTSQ
jgi:hypothetical protein